MPDTEKTRKKRTARAKGRSAPAVTGDILIGELISRYPEVSELLIKHGFHCIGCAVSPYESLKAGAAVHGIDLEPLLKDINALLRKS